MATHLAELALDELREAGPQALGEDLRQVLALEGQEGEEHADEAEELQRVLPRLAPVPRVPLEHRVLQRPLRLCTPPVSPPLDRSAGLPRS